MPMLNDLYAIAARNFARTLKETPAYRRRLRDCIICMTDASAPPPAASRAFSSIIDKVCATALAKACDEVCDTVCRVMAEKADDPDFHIPDVGGRYGPLFIHVSHDTSNNPRIVCALAVDSTVFNLMDTDPLLQTPEAPDGL